MLKGKTVVILGGSSGMGLATAKAAVAEGAWVVITGRSKERLQSAQTALGSGARTAVVDASDEATTRSFFNDLTRLDHLFITAGTVVFDSNLVPAVSELRSAMDMRFCGALYAAKYAAAKLTPGGSITFMSGIAGHKPPNGAAVTAASCGAVEAFARSLAVNLAPIRVNTVCPGWVDTPLLDKLLGDKRIEIVADAAARLPVKRIGRPEEVADAVIFLMKNGFVTGVNLTIDGGDSLI